MGLDILITCTYRSDAEQAQLYAQGRSKPGKVVTNAQPGRSAHNYTLHGVPASLAFDIVPLLHDKPVWDTKGAAKALWHQAAEPAMAHGLRWYGAHGSAFQEYPHFQHPLWDSVKP
jgi:peptidoglycan L-alanyl-D-glutamate endopeptidase CwlK